jgi:rhamnosyltransferase
MKTEMIYNKRSINVFIIGARGYTRNYGGWEALVHGLINNWKDNTFHFYVFEIVNNEEAEGTEIVNGVTCIRLCVKTSGSAAMMIFDAKATFYAKKFIKANHIENPVMYYLGLRIGPFVYVYRWILKINRIVLMENPAGLEWKRTKWNKLVQIYSRIAAWMMAKSVDYLICDSKGILDEYSRMIKGKRPNKLYISYGSYLAVKAELNEKVKEYLVKWNILPNQYYLILGRFVPENNYEIMIKGFMKSNTKKDLVIVCNYESEKNSFYQYILKETGFTQDNRIKLVGTLYDMDILNYLRQNALGYIHGHSVGGTNPGLLEAMATTNVNILYDVIFNREVGGNAAFYFSNCKSLTEQIDQCDKLSEAEIQAFGNKAKERMQKLYSWDFIISEYEKVFYMPFSAAIPRMGEGIEK